MVALFGQVDNNLDSEDMIQIQTQIFDLAPIFLQSQISTVAVTTLKIRFKLTADKLHTWDFYQVSVARPEVFYAESWLSASIDASHINDFSLLPGESVDVNLNFPLSSIFQESLTYNNLMAAAIINTSIADAQISISGSWCDYIDGDILIEQGGAFFFGSKSGDVISGDKRLTIKNESGINNATVEFLLVGKVT